MRISFPGDGSPATITLDNGHVVPFDSPEGDNAMLETRSATIFQSEGKQLTIIAGLARTVARCMRGIPWTGLPNDAIAAFTQLENAIETFDDFYLKAR